MDLSMYENMMTVENIMQVFNISRNQVYTLLSSNEIEGVKIGKKTWRIPKTNVEEYAKKIGLIK